MAEVIFGTSLLTDVVFCVYKWEETSGAGLVWSPTSLKTYDKHSFTVVKNKAISDSHYAAISQP